MQFATRGLATTRMKLCVAKRLKMKSEPRSNFPGSWFSQLILGFCHHLSRIPSPDRRLGNREIAPTGIIRCPSMKATKRKAGKGNHDHIIQSWLGQQQTEWNKWMLFVTPSNQREKCENYSNAPALSTLIIINSRLIYKVQRLFHCSTIELSNLNFPPSKGALLSVSQFNSLSYFLLSICPSFDGSQLYLVSVLSSRHTFSVFAESQPCPW